MKQLKKFAVYIMVITILLFNISCDENKHDDSLSWSLKSIQVTEAWKISQGNGVVVAIIDTGVDINHPDLKGKLLEGYNTLDHSKNVMDDNGHGTMVAGIIAGNGNKIKGVAPGAILLPIKAIDSNGLSDNLSIAEAIFYATDNGAEVINLSLSSIKESALVKQAIKFAVSKGVIVVAATGNWGAKRVAFPANMSDYVISVGSFGKNLQHMTFSNYGPEQDIVAPGDDVESTFWDEKQGSTYSKGSNTSISSAFVSGVVALMLEKNPSLEQEEISEIIKKSAIPVSNYQLFGSGRLNAYNALTILNKGGKIQERPKLISKNRLNVDNNPKLQALKSLHIIDTDQRIDLRLPIPANNIKSYLINFGIPQDTLKKVLPLKQYLTRLELAKGVCLSTDLINDKKAQKATVNLKDINLLNQNDRMVINVSINSDLLKPVGSMFRPSDIVTYEEFIDMILNLGKRI
ncbi:MAG: S8 family serine peptidase [Thermincola sp.]|jgi:hypothetical protein|nr:S8 family serine peptidase [Thermincola sp.]MDT3703693.1 S8 family serine peptidase [Thermincola sp.]